MASEKERALLLSLRKEADVFFKDDNLKNVLTVFGNFPDMGRDECLLISRQKAKATILMKPAEWQRYGRSVKRDAEMIMVFEPYTFKKDVETGQRDLQGKPVFKTETYYSFRASAFYDVSDTEGEELPAELLNNTSYMEYDNLKEALIKLSPYKITEGDRTFCDTEQKIISMDKSLSYPDYIKNLVYQISYAATYENYPGMDDIRINITAKSTAFSILTRFNIDTSDISFAEVSAWNEKTDKDTLYGTLTIIKRLSGRIISETEKIYTREAERNDNITFMEQEITEKVKDILAENNINENVVSTDIYSVKEERPNRPVHMYVLDRDENPGYEADFVLTGQTKDKIKKILSSGKEYAYLSEYLEENNVTVRVDFHNKDKKYDLKFCLENLNITDYMTDTSISAVTAIGGNENEEKVFKTLSDSKIKVDSASVNINTMSMEKQPDMYTYTERLAKYEEENADSRWPMVVVAYTNVEGVQPMSLNLNQAVNFMQRLAEKNNGDKSKYAKLKISYTYNDWRYEHVQDVDIASGSVNFIDYLKLPEKVIRHLKSHNSIMEMENTAKNFAPDTTYGNEYSDKMEDWAYYCRMELNHNSESPIIPKPPEIDSNYLVQNNEWRMEI